MQDDAPQQIPPDKPGWLLTLQQESWQAEILISGGGLVGALSLFDSTDALSDALLLGTTLPPEIGFLIVPPVGLLSFLLAQAFLLHLILRGYWIGLIGFNLVFPQGINQEKLALRGKFKSIIKTNSNTPYLVKIDGLCSLIFAFAFLVILSITGLLLYGFFVGGVASLAGELSGVKLLKRGTSIVLLSFGLLGLLDFLTLGYLKKAKWFSPFYYPVHYVVSLITLSFLYRRLYYSIISNVRPVYIIIGMSAQVLLFVLLTNIASSPPKDISPLNSGPDKYLVLEDEVVTGNTLRFSFFHFPSLEEDLFTEWIKSHKDLKAESFSEIPAREKAELINSAYVITLDSVPAENLIWMTTRRNVLGFSTTRLVYIADVSAMPRGQHELAMRMRLKNNKFAGDSLSYFAKAYFLIDK